MNRRRFVRDSTLGSLAAFAAPLILTPSRTVRRRPQGELIFRPYYVQRGTGPHLGTVPGFVDIGEAEWYFPQWAFASDENWDTFYSNIFAQPDGVRVSDVGAHERFGINVRWNVEGFGFIYMTADAAGAHYTLPPEGETRELNLNYELARSRAAKNRERRAQFEREGYDASRDVAAYLDLSEEYLEDAQRASDEERRAALAQQSLYYSMWGGEKLELDRAEQEIASRGYREGFFLGCVSEDYPYMDSDLFMDLFADVFNYATITHYIGSFEPQERQYNWAIRDELFQKLKARGVTLEGRPIFWADECCTPDWLRNKSYPDLLKYVEQHTHDVVSHYGDGMYAWEVINEAHDYGNIIGLVPEQMVEIAGLICEVARKTNPNVERLINNCCIQADYVQSVDWTKYRRDIPLITPHQFLRMCHEAGVDFTITGQQLYYPYTNRDVADNVRMTERLKQYGRPVQITEIGATSGPTPTTIASGEVPLPTLPYSWHRHWDPDLQAEWIDQMYTVFYSKPWVQGINWYDFVDPHSFIPNGGLLFSPEGNPKPAYHRLKQIQERWRGAAR